MRRALVVLSIMIGLAFGAASFPSTPTQAEQPRFATKADPRSVGPITIDKADDPFDAPTSTITLPTKSPRRGGLVSFGVAPLQNAPKELVKYTYIWDINPEPGGVFLYPDGTQGAFGTGVLGDPQQFKLTLVSNFVFVDANNKLTMKSTKTVATIDIDDGGVIPVPVPPGPGPGPGPVVPVPPVPPAPVVIPDGKYKLGQFIFDLTKTMPQTECAALATELRRISGLISSGAATPAPNPGIRTKAALVSETVIGFPRALGASITSWGPILDKMATQMDSLKLVALPDCQTAYNELATGLEAR